MRRSKVLSWNVRVTPHNSARYAWARILPSFEKGWIMITKNALKAKVAKRVSDLAVRSAVVARLKKAGEPANVPIKISRG